MLTYRIPVKIKWAGDDQWRETRKWLLDHVGVGNWYSNGFSTNLFLNPDEITVWFVSESDAAYFALRWS